MAIAGVVAAGSALLLLGLGLRSVAVGWQIAAIGTGFFLTAVLTFSLQRFLSTTAIRSQVSYRIAFAVGWGIGAGALLLGSPWWLAAGARAVAAALGSFAGGLAATARDYGLWEDNHPPGSELIANVRAAHVRRIGTVHRVPAGKQILDRLGSTIGILLASPVALLLLLGLWLEDPGPLFFVKNSVGLGGWNFRQWKIRTMVRGAEVESGPVLAEVGDERVLRFGRLLRRTALDELPQLANILLGQMSLVGPRPQRTVLVAEYLHQIPAYAERHRLPPGLAGLAQVAGHYYLTPGQKLRFDRLYLKHAGLGFDLRLIAIAFGVVFWLRWRPGWKGRLPRRWLHRRR